MINQGSNRQVASLQGRIRDLGAQTSCRHREYLRRWCAGSLAAVGAAALFQGCATVLPDFLSGVDLAALRLWISAAVPVTGSVVVASGAFLATLAGWSRQGRLADLREELAALPPDRRAEVLIPLKDYSVATTRGIARSLSRSLRVPSEVAPANPPAGRGDEPAPAV